MILNLNPTADTYLRDGAANENSNFGTVSTIVVKSSATPDSGFSRVGLLTFSLASIPSGAVINSVNLITKSSSTGNAASVVRLFEVLRTWGETTATWVKYDGTNNWTTKGARSNGNDIDGDWTDGNPGSLGSYTITGSEVDGTTMTFVGNSDLVALVQASIGSTVSLAIHQDQNDNANWQCYSRDDSTSSNRPILAIDYNFVPSALTIASSVQTPNIVLGGNKIVQPGTLTIVSSLPTPTIQTSSGGTSVTVTPGTLTITASQNTPTVNTGSRLVTISSPLTITASQPTLSVVNETYALRVRIGNKVYGIPLIEMTNL